MKVKVLSSLAKIFPDEICGGYEIGSLSCLKNGRVSFQVAIMTEEDDDIAVTYPGYVNAFWVKSVPAGYCAPEKPERDDYFVNDAKPGEYPDILMPVDGTVHIKKNGWMSLWFELEPKGVLDSGEHKITILLEGKEKAEVSVTVNVSDVTLPEQTLKCTHWFHSDCLSSVYNVEVFSDEYWRIVENFMREAVRHGINVILTPLFTPPLDTAVGGERPTVQLVDVTRHANYKYTFGFDNLKKWVDIATSAGMQYFEMSHLFTQWGALHAPKIMARTASGYKRIFGWETDAGGAGYSNFLRQFAPELIRFIKENNLDGKCMFHTSDEPGMKDLVSYRKKAKLMKELFGEFIITDALSEIEFYEQGIIEHPVTNIHSVETFADKVPDLWTYYCCGPCSENRPNRFFAMPSLRNRILGFIMYKYDIKGFLHWGYNFYYTRYSKRVVDPFTESDAGGEFPAGDSYVVYPAPDGTPYDSLRLKVFYEGIEDFEALRLLESKIGREKTLEILEKDLERPLTAWDYPQSEEWLINKRKEIDLRLSVAE